MEEKEASEERKITPADSVASQMSNLKENVSTTVTSLNIKQYIRQSSNEVTSSQESINSQQETSAATSSKQDRITEADVCCMVAKEVAVSMATPSKSTKTKVPAFFDLLLSEENMIFQEKEDVIEDASHLDFGGTGNSVNVNDWLENLENVAMETDFLENEFLTSMQAFNDMSLESSENGKGLEQNGNVEAESDVLNPLYLMLDAKKKKEESKRNGEVSLCESPTTELKRVSSDPSVKRSPELKRINTYPNIDKEDNKENEDVKDTPCKKLEADVRSHSIAGTGIGGTGIGVESADLFTIKFNAKSDAISFEVKPEEELDASLNDTSIESPLSEPSSPEYYRLALENAVAMDAGMGGSPGTVALSNTSSMRSSNGAGAGSDTSKGASATSDVGSKSSSTGKASSDKKKNRNWYNVLSPTYKMRSEDFKKIFKDKIPSEERLIVDYSCALQKDILVHGRLYITPNWVCFYANIFRWETVLTIRCKDITAMTKEKTARVIPNAIQICTTDDKYFFTSFGTRDKTHFMLFRVWQNALMEQRMSPVELWHWVHSSYGEELGLTDSDCDYIPPSLEEKSQYLQELADKDSLDNSVEIGKEIGGKKATNQNAADGQEPAEDSDSCLIGDLHQLTVPTNILDGVSTVAVSTENGFGEKSRAKSCTLSSVKVPDTSASSAVVNGDFQGDTDAGDTTEDDIDEGEVLCPPDHEHAGFTSLNEVYFIPVDTMLEYLFSDTQFYRDFTASRKTTDVQFTPWPDVGDSKGEKVRNITYTLALNYSIGPKSSQAVEKQIWHGCSKSGQLHVLDTETVNAGVPYGDNFYVFNRWCITKVSAQKCRLRVSSEIRYKKSVWGLAKNFIDKNASAGIMESYNVLGEHLKLESERLRHLSMMSSGTPTTTTAKKRYTHKRKRLASDRAAAAAAKKAGGSGGTDGGGGSSGGAKINVGISAGNRQSTGGIDRHDSGASQFNVNMETVVKFICAVLVVLVLFNLLLFYKLSTLEGRAGLMYPPRADTIAKAAHLQSPPKSQEDWLKLLDQQQHLHELEMERWREILAASITLMDHMKLTLHELHHSIEKRGNNPAEPYSQKANQT